jgi:hypothetical protein
MYKKIVVLFLILVFVTTIISVNAINPRYNLSVRDNTPYKRIPIYTYDTSDCIEYRENEEIYFEVNGNDLSYYHYSEWTYNCCAEMIVQVEVENWVVKFLEVEHFGEFGPCACLCDYELTATVYDLESGEYTVEVWSYFDDGNHTELIYQTIIII